MNGNSMLPTLKTGALLTTKYQFSQRIPIMNEEFIYGSPSNCKVRYGFVWGREGDILIKAIGLPETIIILQMVEY